MHTSKSNAARKLHEWIALDIRLREGQHEVNLAGVPSEKQSEHQTQPNGVPIDGRGVGLPAVHPMRLHTAADVKAGLALANLPAVNSAFAFERLHRRQNVFHTSQIDKRICEWIQDVCVAQGQAVRLGWATFCED
jgi:hypothetical protein